MKIFGIDPGSDRTGYGCVESDGSRHRIIISGAISGGRASFPEKLLKIHTGLAVLLAECRPDCVAIENLFHSNNARSALKLGHARGVAMLTGKQANLRIEEYTPLQIKQTMTGYGRADKKQIQEMVRMQLGLTEVPKPDDCADALAAAIMCAFTLRTEQV